MAAPKAELPKTEPRKTKRLNFEPYEFEESVGYWLVLTAHAYQKAIDEELAPCNLTYRQAQVLGWLVLDGDLSQVDLADRMMIEPATLVGVLDRMERDSLITRTVSRTDRRRKVVTPCARAAEVWSEVIACARRVRARAVAGLSERQLAVLRKSLKALLCNLESRT